MIIFTWLVIITISLVDKNVRLLALGFLAWKFELLITLPAVTMQRTARNTWDWRRGCLALALDWTAWTWATWDFVTGCLAMALDWTAPVRACQHFLLSNDLDHGPVSVRALPWTVRHHFWTDQSQFWTKSVENCEVIQKETFPQSCACQSPLKLGNISECCK